MVHKDLSTCRKTAWSEPLFSPWVHSPCHFVSHVCLSVVEQVENIKVHHHKKDKKKIPGNFGKIVTSILRLLCEKLKP